MVSTYRSHYLLRIYSTATRNVASLKIDFLKNVARESIRVVQLYSARCITEFLI